MGLFSKKMFVCEECGKEYEARFAILEKICSSCKEKRGGLENEVLGYVNYALCGYGDKTIYGIKDLENIIKHRDAILTKYKNPYGITRKELETAGENYKKLTEEECMNIAEKVWYSNYSAEYGAAYCGLFFALTRYQNVIIDRDDVFAVAYINDFRLENSKEEAILCAVFTNDKYVPVFPMLYFGEIGFFEVFKSKKGRKNVQELFESRCPALTYPVMELKELKKIIKKEDCVRGNIDKEIMLKIISDASSSTNAFNSKDLYAYVSKETDELLEKYGYINQLEVEKALKMDKVFRSMFWEEQFKKYLEARGF